MQKTYHDNEIPELAKEKCSVIYALELVGGKWKLPVIWKLTKQKNIRYNELKRRLEGITNRMLTKTLRELEECGIVKREEIEDVVPHVVYSLTDNGKELIPALEIIGKWGRKKMDDYKE